MMTVVRDTYLTTKEVNEYIWKTVNYAWLFVCFNLLEKQTSHDASSVI
jgi:hypothetical protein